VARSHRQFAPDVLAMVGLGGALGSLARRGVADLLTPAAHGFPMATLLTNLSGCLLLGLLLVVSENRLPPSRYLRPFLATGVIGGFTTFSTFAVETDLLGKDGHAGLAVAYVVASLVGGLAATWAGISIGRVLANPKEARA